MMNRHTGTKAAFPKNGLAHERPSILAGKILGHRSWAAGVTAKFKPQPSQTGWHPQDFIYGTPRWFVLSQRWHKLTAVRHQLDLHLTVNNVTQQKNVIASATNVTGLRHNGSPPTPSGNRATVAFIPSWYPVKKWLLRTASPQPDPGARILAPQDSTGPKRILPAALSFRRVQLTAPGQSQDLTVAETVHTQLGSRIQRKLQRVEVRPSYQAVEISERLASASPSGEFVVQSSTSRSIPRSPARGSFDDLPGPPPAPVLNMGEITNEVMRQFDRRLVATRERLGKM